MLKSINEECVGKAEEKPLNGFRSIWCKINLSRADHNNDYNIDNETSTNLISLKVYNKIFGTSRL